jgi:hypothetical protein
MRTATKFLFGIVLVSVLELQSAGATQELTKEIFEELIVSGQ